MIIADADVWVDYLNGVQTAITDELDRLIVGGRIALTGIVMMEMVRGARNDRERDLLDQRLERAVFIDTSREAWEEAGRIAQDLDSRGMPIPPQDSILAGVALYGDHEILTRDKHFERIPGVRIYQPKGDPDA